MDRQYLLLKIFTIFLVVYSASAHDLKNGDYCTAEYTTSGICRPLKECAAGIEMVKDNKHPKICSFSATEPNVCCPDSNNQTTEIVSHHNSNNQIHREKCKLYGKSVFRLEALPILLEEPQFVNRSLCTIQAMTFIIRGNRVIPKEFPHMAIIGYGPENDKSWFNPGFLISENYVLTTAYSFMDPGLGVARYVRLGIDVDDPINHDGLQEFTIIELISHPDFKLPSLHNNIGLIKLDRNAKFNEFVRPACLSNPNTIRPKEILSCLCGSYDSNTKINTHYLRRYMLNIYPYDRCNETFSPNIPNRRLPQGISNDNQFCGVMSEDNYDCQCSSQIYDADVYCMYSIQGLELLSVPDRLGKRIYIYTRISAYIPWIEAEVWNK